MKCQRRDCPANREQWGRDQITRFKWNFSAWDGYAQMVTLTAPGKDRLPWDLEVCGHPDDSLCTGGGKSPCRVQAGPAMAWNLGEPARWKRARKRTDAKARRKGITVSKFVILGYALQVRRGVIHRHVVIGWKGVPPSASRWYVRELQRAAKRCGYGRESKAGEISKGNGINLASYLGRYIAQGSWEAIAVAPRGALVTFVAPRLTRITGVTTRHLRMWRRARAKWPNEPLIGDLAQMILFFRWAEAQGVDPFTWHRRPPPRRPPPRDRWEPIAVSPAPEYMQLILVA